MAQHLDLSGYGLAGRQTDIRSADLLERGVWIVVVPEETSPYVAHVWPKGREVISSRKEAEELCRFLQDKGMKAILVRIAPDSIDKAGPAQTG